MKCQLCFADGSDVKEITADRARFPACGQCRGWMESERMVYIPDPADNPSTLSFYLLPEQMDHEQAMSELSKNLVQGTAKPAAVLELADK